MMADGSPNNGLPTKDIPRVPVTNAIAISQQPLPQLTRLPNSSSLERLYKKALKDAHRLKSPIARNLSASKKRTHSLSSATDNTQENLHNFANNDGWLLPKKYVRNSQASTQEEIAPNNGNRYSALCVSQSPDMEIDNLENSDTTAASQETAHHTQKPTSTKIGALPKHRSSVASFSNTPQRLNDNTEAPRFQEPNINNRPAKPPPIHADNISLRQIILYLPA